MDPVVGQDVCFVQFPQRFDGIDKSDRYANRNIVFFDVSYLILITSSKVLRFLMIFCGFDMMFSG